MLSPTENVKDDIQHSIQQIYLKRYDLVKVFCGKEWNNDMSNKTTGVDGRVWDDQEGPRAFSFRTFFLLNLFIPSL